MPSGNLSLPLFCFKKKRERISAEELAQLTEFQGSERAVGQALAGLHWHETYHTGQLELLRQLAGKNDAII
jgi:hypothetical protein